MTRELLDIEVARRAVLERVRPLPAEDVAIDDALGRVLAEDVASTESIPPFDNSAMDGFAVRAEDTGAATRDAPLALRVVDESRAGAPAGSIAGPGEAIAISTGAAMPVGCDAIVRIEEVEESDGSIAVSAPVEPGRDVRRAGDDVEAGAVVLRRGDMLGPSELGVLASIGRAVVRCARQPRLSVLTTGDELVGPDAELGPGQIRDANAHSIPALARSAGALVTWVGHTGDDAAATREAIRNSLDTDVAVVCGGVSVGEHDHVRPAFAALDVEEAFWGLALRPGRPTWFGRARDGALAFGLPGNPVSAVVTFILLVRPALLALAGADPERHGSTAVLDAPYPKRPGRAHFVRVRLQMRDDGWHAEPTKEQASHVLTSMLGADAFAIIPADRADVEAGQRVQIELLPSAGMSAGEV
ncbi:MAG: gephyrin-like molybdotransferase Glp [Solirubrobacterales bacterium]